MEDQKQISPVLIVFLALIIGIVLSAGVVGYAFFYDNSLKQVNKEGAVKIAATYLPSKNNGDGISFSLLVETHSDEFDVYDVRKISFLRVDAGQLQSVVKWTPSGKGHHIDGTIRFAEVLEKGTHTLQLIFKNIDGMKERILEWHILIEG